ncbi:MAG: sugar phosphate isomerase/epimerase family protein [Candidatus Brocadiia bacterium]
MRLGYLTQLTEEEARRAATIGYDCLEAHGPWEMDEIRLKNDRKREIARVQAFLEETGISISAIAIFRPGYEDPKPRVKRYRAYIKLCAEMGIDTITTLSGGVENGTLEENLDYFEDVFSRAVSTAEDKGVRIAFENWPGLRGTFPPIQTVNFAFSPGAWEQMFDRVKSKMIGLEFDPSHLVWQGMDWAKVLRRFANRVYHVHAKDTEIMQDKLKTDGFFSAGWWRYRLPGYGRVDWHKLTSILKEIGYDGGICVEHEDPVFTGDRWEEGLVKAHSYLRPLV